LETRLAAAARQRRQLVHLVEETVPALAVVTVQERVVLHILQRVTRETSLFESATLEMVAILVP
jgi:hypothetical protein